MKRIKNFTLGILGVSFLSLGLYACSNDDGAATENKTSEKIMITKSLSNKKIIPVSLGFGRAYDVRMNCVSATTGFCADILLPGPGTHPSDGIGKIDDFTMRLTMSISTYQTNKEYFKEESFVIDNEFFLAPDVLNELEFSPETVVSKQTAKVIKVDEETFYIDLYVTQK